VDLSGIYPALTTPFDSDGAVAVNHLKHNIRLYNSTGVSGYVVLGSTGESVMLSKSEGESILLTVREVADKSKRLIAGTGAESTAETILKTKRAAELGYNIALVKTPYYYKPAYKPAVFAQHYRAVADASPIPVLLYSVPIFTGVALESADVVALSDHPNIVGIKDSSGDVRRVAETVAGTPREFQTLVGAASTVLSCLAIGARGAILALACALPEKCVELYGLFTQGRHEAARELQLALVTASRLIVSELGIAGVKYAMDQRGYRGGVPRLPLLPLQEEQKTRLSTMLASLEPATLRA
jgi:4-hydroxy-tetrahydrodipicolinate synthase